MSNYTHRIRRLRYLIVTGNQTKAFAIRKSLYDRWQEELLPIFERAFDEIVSGDRTVHIPKLEINLKVTSEQELMEVLPELIQQQLREQLQSNDWEAIPTTQSEVIWQEATTQQNQFATLLHYLQTGSVPWQVAHAPASTIAAQLKETSRQQRSQLLNYLYNKPETAAFYFRLLQLLPQAEFFALANALSDRFLPEWRTAISEFIGFVLDTRQIRLNQPTQWQLVAAILSECLSRSEQGIRSDLSRIVAKILAEAGSAPQSGSLRDRDAFFARLPATVAVLFQPQPSYDNLSAPATNSPPIESQETTAAAQYIDSKNYSETPNEVKELPLNPDSFDLFEHEGEPSDQEADAILLQPQLNDDNPSTPTPNLSGFENQEKTAADQYLEPQLRQHSLSTPTTNLNATNLPTADNQEISAAGSETRRSPLNPDSIGLFENRDELSNRENELSNYALTPAVEIAATGDEFPLSVNYAGLVLLHPFISPFFEATGVKETDSKTIATAQMARAAALLHFLATGQEELYEYELGLIKILLGLEPETPLLVGEGLLQESDREEAEAVLQSMINYWTVLKNTSINGLRSSFLQRSGLLHRTENGWRLQVEHQSFDLLLEHLPWSISIIKLSWMKQPLYTEWQTF